ncbi:MAG: carboxypeptidase regulatory-like domain-containing protein [Spirosomataceae bacterium]
MKLFYTTKWAGCILFFVLTLLGQLAVAQITTSSISGRIKDAKGGEIPGATVLAMYLPTGAKYGVASSVDGHYTIANMNPGGPYKIIVTFVGYKPQEIEGVQLNLGATTNLDFVIQEEVTALQEVVVKGDKGGTKIGTGISVGENQIKSLPTLSRSLTDMTRLTPQSANNSFAGTNFRYNNVTIDGTINNDAIGFSPSQGGQSGTSGMPGSSTRTNPISLDAIQDIQVYIAPYDVKIGNFTGGSINAVTRSGTNDVTGSVYAFGRNASITGPNNAGDKAKIPNSYHDYQLGFRVGFPILKNKLFFFTNQEITRRQEPVFYGAGYADASGKQLALVDVATAQKITDFVNTNYGFNVGESKDYTIYSNSNKFFNRLDWNISDKHQLSVRNNYITSEATNLERDAANFRFSSMDFKQTNDQNSTVAELKSRFGNASNSLIIGYSDIHDYRTPLSSNAAFPQVEISANGGTIFLGNDREATVFNMKQKTFEFTDNFTWFKGKHTFLVGTHNEIYNINYGFVNSWNGRVAYRSLDEFFAGKVNRVRGSYSFTDNDRNSLFENPYAKFHVAMFSLYGQDEIQVTDKLRLSPGLRFDLAKTDSPPISTLSQNTPIDKNAGTTYNSTPLSQINNKIFGQVLVSPRLGFNYDVNGDKSLIVRGGSGIFTGKIPFAWLGYAFYNDGVGFGSFDVNNLATRTNVTGDVLKDGARAYAFNNGQGSQTQVDVVSNNFKMPQVWRSSLAVDYTLNGYKFTLEGIYTKTINDLKFQQVNLKDSVRYYSYDVNRQMPIYLSGGATGQKINTAFSNAYMLSNTSEGYRYSLTAQVSKQYPFGLNFSAAYTYGQSFDITNGIRNSMESNWQLNQSLTPNDPKLGYSNFDIRHRIISQIGYNKQWNKLHGTSLSVVINAQSGNPFTWGFVNSTIANTPQAAGLAYVFKDVAEATKYFVDYKDASGATITAAQQAQQFMDFVNGDSYLSTRKGNFTERNGGRTPWNTTADVRIMHTINVSPSVKNNRPHTIQLSLDIINFTNLLNPSWGRVYFVPNTFNSTSSLGLTRVNSGTAADPTYRFVTPATPYSVDQLASRFQAQVGARYSF